MTAPAPSPAGALLAEIRLRTAQRAAHPQTEAEGEAISDAMVLLAALEAVLALHKPAGTLRTGWGPVCEYDRHRWPCPEHEAIEAALTGTQEGTGQ